MTKNQQQYAEYKDSGVEWLGEIPREWIPIRLKHLLLESLVYGANEAAEDDNPKNPRYIRITDMNSDGSLDSDTFRSLPMHVAENYLLKDGDILLARSGATVGKSFYYKSDFGICCFAGYLIRARPNKTKLSGKFAYWFFQSDSYWKYVAGSQIKATIQNVSAEKYGDLYLSLPKKIEEQTQISNFLDHETAKIDSLIEKQKQLIQLLKEKRQAVISHAVTKGLNPNVPIKDSNVEWLGQVPEHWIVSGFKKYLESIVDYRGKTPEKVDEGVFLVTARNIKNGQIDYALSQEFVAKKDYEQIMSRGKPILKDVLFTTEAPLGEVAQIDNVDIALAQRIIKFRGKENFLDNTYLKYFIISQQFQDSLMTFATGSTALGIKAERLGYLKIAIPPLIEQYKIVEYLEIYLLKNKSLIQKARSAIQLMQERRTALISAAVTGKIDVRNWQNPNKNNETNMESSA